VNNGGKRVRAGRPHRDSVRIECSIPRPVYDELTRRESSTGVYRSRIAATILCEELIGGMVDRELNDVTRVAG
jgi:hypothetical protein